MTTLVPGYTPPAGVVFTNGKISITKDLIFGLCVMGEDGWIPFDQCTKAERELVLRLIDFNPTCFFLEALQVSHKELCGKEDTSCRA